MNTTNLAIQLVFAILMLAATAVVGILPSRSRKFNNPRMASLGNCFSAGIFLSVALIHLIPEGVADIGRHVESEFAVGNVLPLLGYLLILFLEKVLFFQQVHGVARTDLAQFEAEEEDPVKEAAIIKRFISSSERLSRSLSSMSEVEADEMISRLVEGEPEQPSPLELKKKKILTGLLLSVALGVHALLEGIAIGLQKAVKSTVNIGLAVCIHKLPAALALGINTRVMQPYESMLLIGVFSIASPLGICIGIGLQTLNIALLEGIILTVCAGTFLYISTTELIAEEFASPHDKWLKMLSFFTGFALFTGLSQAIQDE